MGLIARDPNISDTGTGTGNMSQVVLYNDNVNSFDHVINSLVSVFGHSGSMAAKLAMEAHTKGRTIAEVEEMEKAIVHKGQLVARQLTADVERL